MIVNNETSYAKCKKYATVIIRKGLVKGRMEILMFELMQKYVTNIKQIYGVHVRQVILYGSYARGDYSEDSDVDIMILLDLSDIELKKFSRELSYMTYDFNLDNDVDIKPLAKSEAHFKKWCVNYPFYSNVEKEGVVLYAA